MTRKGIVGIATVLFVAAILVQPSSVSAQARPAAPPPPPPKPAAAEPAKPAAQASSPGGLGSVRRMHAVVANGQQLPAGQYSLRLSNDAVTPVTGQTTDESKWVEFVQGGQVKGKELATVLTAANAKQIAKKGLPSAGAVKVETLKGND